MGLAPTLTLFLHVKDPSFLADPDWMESHPLGGTESSALHMAKALRDLGYEVRLTAKVEDLKIPCDIFISTRVWQVFARGIKPGKLNYLWCTDDADQPSVAPLKDPKAASLVYSHLTAAFVLSSYQARRWWEVLHLPIGKTFITRNGIPLGRFSPETSPIKGRPRAAYYGSTPYRGLAELLEAWPRVRAAVPDAALHVFSSMGIYGVADTPEFEALYAKAKADPSVHYHGAQGQGSLRPVIQTCRALAYPCSFPETSCITAMEAMAAGCAVVANDQGALPETAKGNPLTPARGSWLPAWEASLIALLRDDGAYEAVAAANLRASRGRDWLAIAREWQTRFGADFTARAR